MVNVTLFCKLDYKTGMFRATYPWSAIIWRRDTFVKRYREKDVEEGRNN
jgi:hypothetical protein